MRIDIHRHHVNKALLALCVCLVLSTLMLHQFYLQVNIQQALLKQLCVTPPPSLISQPLVACARRCHHQISKQALSSAHKDTVYRT